MSRFVLALLSAALVGGFAHAAEPVVVLVVNAKVPVTSLTTDEAKSVYLGRTTMWSDNTPVRVFDRPVSRPVGVAFYAKVLHMVPMRFRRHWQSQQLSGRSLAPQTVVQVEELCAAVANTPGAIGYALQDELPTPLPPGVRVIPLVLPK